MFEPSLYDADGLGMSWETPLQICSSTDQGHLQTLARLSRLINDIEILRALRAAESADEALDALLQRENKLGMTP